MATLIVAREGGRLIVGHPTRINEESWKFGYVRLSFIDSVGVLAWVGDVDMTAVRAEIPFEDVLMGEHHEQGIGLCTEFLRNYLAGHDALVRAAHQVSVVEAEFIFATPCGLWRVDHTFGVHRCKAYACIGANARIAEALVHTMQQTYPQAGSQSVIVRALDTVALLEGKQRGSRLALLQQ